MTHITIEKEKLESVLEALEANQPINYCLNNNGERFPMMQEDPFRFERNTKAINAIKEALAQRKEPEQEQIAVWLEKECDEQYLADRVRAGDYVKEKGCTENRAALADNCLHHLPPSLVGVGEIDSTLQPEQEPVAWKLVPIEPTREMLEAMDECSIEGYDEHLYAGHAASVYMAAIDAAPVLPQQCYCGDITRLGVVHRADSFCDEKPEQREPTKQEHNILMGALKRSGKFVAQPEQEPVAWMDEDGDVLSASVVSGKGLRNIPLYTTPPQRKPLTHEQRFDLLTKFEPHKNKWEAPAILIDMVEAAHGIKEKA